MPAGTLFCRQGHSRIVFLTGAILEAIPGIVLSTGTILDAMPTTGAASEACLGGLGAYLGGLGTWETCLGPFDMATRRCFIDRINVDRRKVLPAGTLFCRQGHSRIVFSTGAILEAIPAIIFIDKSNPGCHANNWNGLRSLFGRPGGLSGRPGNLGNLSGPV